MGKYSAYKTDALQEAIRNAEAAYAKAQVELPKQAVNTPGLLGDAVVKRLADMKCDIRTMKNELGRR